MNETVTLVTDSSAHEVAAGWPANDFTWIDRVQHTGGSVSCLLVDNIGNDLEDFTETLLDGFPETERIAWTQLSNTSDSCVAEVYERAPGYTREPIKRILKVSAGIDYWHLARDAVREQLNISIQTWYEIIDGEPDVRTTPRDETPY